jgi:hypothetical protein
MRKLLVIIGSLWSGFVIQGANQLTMRCVTARGATVHEVQIGELVRLEVISPGVTAHGGWPIIEGLSQVQVAGRSTRMSSTMGQGVKRDEVVYALDIQFSRPGTYTLGPATVTLASGVVISSQPLTLEVRTPAPSQSAGAHAEPAYAQWNITTRGYVYRDEVIPCSLTFTTQDEKIQLRSVSSWSCDWNELTLPQQPQFQRTNVRGNTVYEYRWEGVMIPLQAGQQWLPSIAFSYDKPSATSWFPWSIMQMNATQTVTAQPLEVLVKDLPPTSHQIAGVGSIDRIAWKQISAEVRAGEATTLVRTIEGAFIPERIYIPLPQTSPGIRLYSSHVTVTGQYPHVRQETEYIVQGIDAGDHRIIEQTLVFFDPKQERYITHYSPAVQLQITPGQKKETPQKPLTTHESDTPAELPEPLVQDQAIENHVTWIQRLTMGARGFMHWCRAVITYQLPFSLFLILLVIPLLWCIMRSSLQAWYARVQRWYAAHQRMKIALREIRAAERAQDYIRLHAALIQYFTEEIHLDIHTTTSDYVQTWLAHQGAPDDMVQAWHHFYQQLEQRAFAQPVTHERGNFTREAAMWLHRIGKFIRRTI